MGRVRRPPGLAVGRGGEGCLRASLALVMVAGFCFKASLVLGVCGGGCLRASLALSGHLRANRT